MFISPYNCSKKRIGLNQHNCKKIVNVNRLQAMRVKIGFVSLALFDGADLDFMLDSSCIQFQS